MILLPTSSEHLGLQVCTTVPNLFFEMGSF
jgi:hypothetical protein